MRAALCVVMLVACNDVHGVAVLVHPNNPDVRYVRLFMGAGDSATTDLTGDSNVTAANASYWVRDPGNACDTCDVVPVTGEVVKFGFVTDAAVPVAIAVGYDAQKQPIAAGLAHDLAPSDQSNDFFGYDLDLAPFDAFSKSSSTSLQLDLWSPPEMAPDPFHAQCVGIIDPNADHPYFVVRDQDQDCDGLINGMSGECTPDYYLGTAPPDPSDATCLVEETVKCRLGGRGCVDNGGNAPACSPSNTCLPTNLCGLCMDSYDCAAQILSSTVSPTAMAHYTCTVNLATDGTACPTPISIERPPSGGYDCTKVEIADANTQLTDKITQTNITVTAALHTDESCSATLAFEGRPPQPTTSLSALVAFTLKNNAGIAMPVTIQFQTGGCANQIPCALDVRAFGEPTQAACATAWTGPSTQVALPSTGSPDSENPTLTPDQKQMFFESNGTVFQATKSNGVWTTAVATSLTTNSADHAPELSGDGLSLVMVSTNVSAVTNLYIATRQNLTMTFGPADPVVNDPMMVFSSATFAPDNPTGTHHMIAAGSINSQLGLFDLTLDPTRHMIAGFNGIPINIANIEHPHLTPDGLHLYFNGDGSLNGTTSLYVASRRNLGETFRDAVELQELDDPQAALNQTSAAWVSGGGHTMYYTHADAGGTTHVYQTTRVTF